MIRIILDLSQFFKKTSINPVATVTSSIKREREKAPKERVEILPNNIGICMRNIISGIVTANDPEDYSKSP
jgi:hypothetical protein